MLRKIAIALLIVMGAASCAADETEPSTDQELKKVGVVLPGPSPIFYGYYVAQSQGFYEEEGIEAELSFGGGGSETIMALVAGRAPMAHVPVGNVLEALSEGHTDVRAVFALVYGSLFSVVVPADSDIDEIADLKDKTIGMSEAGGGEQVILGAMARAAGLSENDYATVVVGAGTASAVRALKENRIDAVAVSVNDFALLKVAGLELRQFVPEPLEDLPAASVVTTTEFLENNRDLAIGFLRATAKGYEFGSANPDAAIAILEEALPELFTGPGGEAILRESLPLTQAPPGSTLGEQTPEEWAEFFEYVLGQKPPIDLGGIVVDDLIDEANDYDHEEIQDAAENFEG